MILKNLGRNVPSAAESHPGRRVGGMGRGLWVEAAESLTVAADEADARREDKPANGGDFKNRDDVRKG
jgi:hypothetical protein